MSYHVFFAFSTCFKTSLFAPVGTLDAIRRHISNVEDALGLSPPWDWHDPALKAGFPDVADELLCETVREHNDWVRRLYSDTSKWFAEPVEGGEEITPAEAGSFWYALKMLKVEPDRWTEHYYRYRMEHFYEVMRGREDEGVTWQAKPLTPEQAAAVVWLFADLLDSHDIRLDVPRGHDHLTSGDEHTWCTRCGAVTDADANACRRRPCKASSRDCPKYHGDGIVDRRGKDVTCPKCDGDGTVYA